MNISLIGYGKMGKTIEKFALERKHSIISRIDVSTFADTPISTITAANTQVAIEFSQPEAAFNNIKYCLENGIPIVCGTTGWLSKQSEVYEICKQNKGTFFYSSNYSLGVNIFFHLNKILAKMMAKYGVYDVSLEEIHHTEKKDAPSGTAITLAQGILHHQTQKENWVNQRTKNPNDLEIISKREPDVAGTHVVSYHSDEDLIQITHKAHSRKGFALGAVLAAEFIKDKKGVLGMEDLLDLE